MKMRAGWNGDYLGVLIVAPLTGEHEGKFGIIDGRHRFLAGKDFVAEWRCDVHPDCTTVAEKARLKLAIDQQRRRVSALEHYLERRLMGDPMVLEIDRICEEKGFEIGRLRSGKPYERIGAVTALLFLHEKLGADGLRRVMAFNTHWIGQPGTNTSNWLRALGLLVRDGYYGAMTPSAWTRLSGLVPMKTIRIAQGEAAGGIRGAPSSWGVIAYEIAPIIRKRARLPRRPPSSPRLRGVD